MTRPQDVMKIIERERIVAVLRADDPATAIRAAHAVVDGGLVLVEVTMSTPQATEVIREIASREGVIAGVGTVIDREQADAAIDAGAVFVVSPHTDPDLIGHAKARGVAVAAGAGTATEAVTAWKAGADLVKIFPAAQIGGPAFIKALRGPLPQIPYMTTGGVNTGNAREYLDAGALAVGLGGSLFPGEALDRGEFDIITRKAREALEAVQDL